MTIMYDQPSPLTRPSSILKGDKICMYGFYMAHMDMDGGNNGGGIAQDV